MEDTLQNRIYAAKNCKAGDTYKGLDDNEKQQLYDLVSKRCSARTKDRLYNKIFKVPLSCWETFGIFSRVEFSKHGVSYCAGQSYPDEIRTVRQCIRGY